MQPEAAALLAGGGPKQGRGKRGGAKGAKTSGSKKRNRSKSPGKKTQAK